MNIEEYEEEIKGMTQGRHVVIPVNGKGWWDTRLKNGFFYFLENDELPVKVVGVDGQVFYFNTGLDKKKVYQLMRDLYPKPSNQAQALAA